MVGTKQGTLDRFGSEAVTEGIRVRVEPSFMAEHSDVENGKFLFSYQVRISNEGGGAAQLVTRRWVISDADASVHEVNGEGVVGNQPYLRPGEHFEYGSYCPLETCWGTMEGSFRMVRDDGSEFDAEVPRFYLVAPGDAAG